MSRNSDDKLAVDLCCWKKRTYCTKSARWICDYEKKLQSDAAKGKNKRGITVALFCSTSWCRFAFDSPSAADDFKLGTLMASMAQLTIWSVGMVTHAQRHQTLPALVGHTPATINLHATSGVPTTPVDQTPVTNVLSGMINFARKMVIV